MNWSNRIRNFVVPDFALALAGVCLFTVMLGCASATRDGFREGFSQPSSNKNFLFSRFAEQPKTELQKSPLPLVSQPNQLLPPTPNWHLDDQSTAPQFGPERDAAGSYSVSHASFQQPMYQQPTYQQPAPRVYSTPAPNTSASGYPAYQPMPQNRSGYPQQGSPQPGYANSGNAQHNYSQPEFSPQSFQNQAVAAQRYGVEQPVPNGLSNYGYAESNQVDPSLQAPAKYQQSSPNLVSNQGANPPAYYNSGSYAQNSLADGSPYSNQNVQQGFIAKQDVNGRASYDTEPSGSEQNGYLQQGANLQGRIFNPNSPTATERALQLQTENERLRESLMRTQKELEIRTTELTNSRKDFSEKEEELTKSKTQVADLGSQVSRLTAEVQIANRENENIRRKSDDTLKEIESTLDAVLIQSISSGGR